MIISATSMKLGADWKIAKVERSKMKKIIIEFLMRLTIFFINFLYDLIDENDDNRIDKKELKWFASYLRSFFN